MWLRSIITLAFASIISISNAQDPLSLEYIKKGIELHDQGNFQAAIKQYKKALKVDANDPLANYEISSTYYAMSDYGKAIKHADVVIKAKDKFVDQAYILKGTAQDAQKDTKGAIKTYKKGIKSFPDEYLLHFNLALTYYNSGDSENAQTSLFEALRCNPSHSSSHLLLAYIQGDEGGRIQSVLAAHHFLLLEPNTSRSEPIYQLLHDQLNEGVSEGGENTININLSADGDDEFQPAELMLSLLAASKTLEENEGLTELELYAQNMDKFFGMLGELNDGKKNFWWKYYVNFFNDMHENGHVEAFCYYVSIPGGSDETMKWLEENEEKLVALSKWYDNYKP